MLILSAWRWTASGIVYVADSANNTIRKGAVSVGPPVILLQPQSQTLNQGNNVTFRVTATGTAPLSYQWLFNNTTISTATASAYTITNVQPTDGGNYSVLVTNSGGTVTSSVASLQVDTNTAVRLAAVTYTNGSFSFWVTGPVGYYVIWASTNPSIPLTNWLPVATNSTSTGLWDYTDPGATNAGRRFYRALLQ